MVINEFHIFCTYIRLTLSDTPLIFDTNPGLTGTITLERFKVIAGGRLQIILDHEDPLFSPLLPKKRAENGEGNSPGGEEGQIFQRFLDFFLGVLVVLQFLRQEGIIGG